MRKKNRSTRPQHKAACKIRSIKIQGWKTAEQICKELGCTMAWLSAMIWLFHLPVQRQE